MRDVRSLLVQLIREQQPVTVIAGEVKAVDRTTCDVQPFESEVLYQDIMLNPNASEEFLVTPKVGSTVVVLLFPDQVSGVVVSFSEVEQVTINAEINLDGNTNTTVKGQGLVRELGKLSNRVDKIIEALGKAPVAAGDGGASFKASIVSSLSSLESEDFSEIENQRVRHG
ncbi:hypothetical protein V6R21_19065 [Limibacter armeniacum]|uniref:hypothetical protein n=1 Tax=Limibacter armeniacum TaxID=466084 RepID=UPI002FE620BA